MVRIEFVNAAQSLHMVVVPKNRKRARNRPKERNEQSHEAATALVLEQAGEKGGGWNPEDGAIRIIMTGTATDHTSFLRSSSKSATQISRLIATNIALPSSAVFLVLDHFLDVLVQRVDLFAVDVQLGQPALVVNAKHMRDALPNASFIGFTGTPIALEEPSLCHVWSHNLEDGVDLRVRSPRSI
jgi:SWI2/SNF2 ATPase